jgi:hypothetical protein
MKPKSVTISVVGGKLTLTPPALNLTLDEYMQWCVPDSKIKDARVDATSSPFGSGVFYVGWDTKRSPCFPCPALPVLLKGKFQYSVCACVGDAPNSEALVAAGELDVG